MILFRFRLIEKYDSCKIFSQGKTVKNICTLQTTQLLEAVSDLPDGELPTGLVVANDSDNARCYMLTHQVLVLVLTSVNWGYIIR